MVKLSHQINRLEDGNRQRGIKSMRLCRSPPRPLASHSFSVEILRDPSRAIFSALECSATPREPFFQRWNAPRPLADHFFSVEILRDPSRAILSAWKCSATPRGPFFQRWNAPRPLADHFFSVEILRDPSRRVFSALECSATPRGTLPTGKIRSVSPQNAQLLIINVKKVLFRNFSILKVCEIGITKLLLPA